MVKKLNYSVLPTLKKQKIDSRQKKKNSYFPHPQTHKQRGDNSEYDEYRRISVLSTSVKLDGKMLIEKCRQLQRTKVVLNRIVLEEAGVVPGRTPF